jgi:stage IV sporulation protein FB
LIKLFGTTYRIHPLFVLLLVLAVFAGYISEMLTLFAIVLIHEIGHVTAARHFGWRVRYVQLLPFGGVAEVDDHGLVPAHEELIVAIAGPLQHVWIIGFSLLMRAMDLGDPSWWSYFIQANVLIALFNLLPVLPLDGGKILLAGMSWIMSYHRALVVCSWMSLSMSVLLGIGAVFPLLGQGVQLNVLMIAVFLFWSNWFAHQHIPFRFIRFLMGRGERTKAHIRRGAKASPIVTQPGSRIVHIMRLFMREKYHLIYELDDKGTIRRVLPEQKLIDTYLYEKKPESTLSDL